MPKTARSPQRYKLPQIVASAWVMSRYGISKRTLEKRMNDGTLKPFKPSRRDNKFYAEEVVEAFEGRSALSRYEFIPVMNYAHGGPASRHPEVNPHGLAAVEPPPANDDDDLVEGEDE